MPLASEPKRLRCPFKMPCAKKKLFQDTWTLRRCTPSTRKVAVFLGGGLEVQHWLLFHFCTSAHRTLVSVQCACLNQGYMCCVFSFFFFPFITRAGSDVFFTRCLENCLCCRIFPLLPPTLLSRSHPSAPCPFLLFPLSPWHPNLQSDFILSPHQSHKREGAVSSASLSSSLPLSLSPTRICIAPSRPPAKALMLQKVLQKKFLYIYIYFHLFFLYPSILPLCHLLPLSTSADGVISKWIICIALFLSLSFSRF